MAGQVLSMRLAAAALALITGAMAPSSSDTQRLLDRLFANYSTLVRPVKDQNQVTETDIRFTIKHLESVDIKSQTMRSIGHFSINWTDEFLTWRPEDYGGIEYITVPEDKIWKPDYLINNDINGKKQMGDGSSLVVIDSNGQTLWEPGHVASTLCYIDITYFPFDNQMCAVNLTSWMTSEISLHTTSTQGVCLNDLKENGEFEVTGARVDRTVYPMTYKPDEMLEGVSFVIMLKRRTTFYWLSLVSPLIAFPFLSPLSFLVPADSGEKTTLAITALLSVFVFMGVVYDIMPRLSNTVSYFVLLASAQVFISLLTVVCNVIVLCIYELSSDRIVPRCLKRLVIRYRHRPPGKMLKVNESTRAYNDVTSEESEADYMEEVKWVEVARFLDRVCFIVSLVSVSLVTIIFGILMSNQ